MSKEKVNLIADYPNVNVKDAVEMIKQRWRNRTTKLRTLRFVGHRGIGKSQIIEQAARELGQETGKPFECKVLTLSVMESPDFNGLPYVQSNKTLYAQPHFIPTEGFGILLLDEFGRAPHDIQQANLTFIENREVNGHKLGDGWIIVAADNPGMEMGGNVTYQVAELDPALKDRLSTFLFQPTPKETISHLGAKYGVGNPVVRWINKDAGVIAYDGVGRSTPRSLEYLIKALLTHASMDPYTVAAGEIGTRRAREFVTFLNQDVENISLAELMKMDKKAKEAIKKVQDKANLNPNLFNSWNNAIVMHAKTLSQSKHGEGVDLPKNKDFAVFLADYLNQIELPEFWKSFILEQEFFQPLLGVHHETVKENIEYLDKIDKNFREHTIKINDQCEEILLQATVDPDLDALYQELLKLQKQKEEKEAAKAKAEKKK